MKTNKSIARTVMAIAIMFACSNPAQAQFGNIMNKAKNTVSGTVEKMAGNAVDKAKDKARKKMYATVKKKVLDGKDMPEQPWPMNEKAFKEYVYPPAEKNPMSITWYLYSLGQEDPANIRTLKAQLDARYQANKKILKAQETGLFSQLGGYADALLREVEEEQGRWDAFYGELSQHINLYISNVKATDTNGQGAWMIESKAGDISCPADKTTYWVYKNKAGKMQFFTIEGRGAFASDTDVALIKAEVARMNGIAILTEGLVDQGNEFYGNSKNELALVHAKAVIWASHINQALDNNKPENLERLPMPKAGSLNKSLKAKALSLAKASDSDIIDVVITSNTWDIKRELGIPKHRVAYGYVIRNTKMGKQASKRSWCQDYQGGGKYGGLRNFGVGMDTFYIK